MSDDKLRKLNNYFDKYIDRMLINDINLLIRRNDELEFSYPYILLTCSGIDFFGGIEKGFRSPKGDVNSKPRFKWFITEWMSKVNPLYEEISLACLIYNGWRNGTVHQATLKEGFEASSVKYRGKHLYYIGNDNRIFIDSLQFAKDFIEAQKRYRAYIDNKAKDIKYINLLYDNLSNMMGENKNDNKQNFNNFIKILIRKNFVFNSTEDESPAIPSAAAGEEDI